MNGIRPSWKTTTTGATHRIDLNPSTDGGAVIQAPSPITEPLREDGIQSIKTFEVLEEGRDTCDDVKGSSDVGSIAPYVCDQQRKSPTGTHKDVTKCISIVIALGCPKARTE
jgi:hypothetical protein